MGKKRITFAEIARRLCVSRATAKKLVRDGTIPGGRLLYKTRAGREKWSLDAEAVEAWLTDRRAA